VTSIYTKLTPAKRRLFGYTQLWLAPDHILLLISTQFAEDYKRFAFSDIQSIVVTQLPSRVVPQVIMIVAALAWTCLWFTVNSAFAKGAFAVTGALALLWPIVDIARGPRCRCYLHTRVSGELLAPVSRMKTARKVLAIIRPMTEAVQGVLPAEQPAAAEIPSTPWEPRPPEIVSSPGYVPEVLFELFLINALVIWASIHFPKIPEISSLLISSLVAEVLLIVVALARRGGRDTRVVIYVVMVLALVGIASDVMPIGRSLLSWYTSVIEKAKHGDKSTPFIVLFQPADRGAVIAYTWRAAAGAFGLAAAFFERRKR
jgi:hypothetical protein